MNGGNVFRSTFLCPFSWMWMLLSLNQRAEIHNLDGTQLSLSGELRKRPCLGSPPDGSGLGCTMGSELLKASQGRLMCGPEWGPLAYVSVFVPAAPILSPCSSRGGLRISCISKCRISAPPPDANLHLDKTPWWFLCSFRSKHPR